MVVATIAVACSSVPSSSLPSAAASEPLDEAVRASQVDGPFTLTLELPRSVWNAGQEITGIARLDYAGVGPRQIWGSGRGPIYFSVNEVNGDRDVDGGQTADCRAYQISGGSPITSGLTRSGGITGSEPDAAWRRAFLTAPTYTLPAGDWEIIATASFLVDACAPPSHTLTAKVLIHVRS